jgi:hypothetical protein
LVATGRNDRVPRFTQVRTDTASLTELRPAELRADLLVLLEDESRPALAAVVEVQLDVDPDKLVSWPAYLVGARSRYRCAAVVLVLAPSGRVATWAAQPVELGPGSVFRATVIGPDGLVDLADPREAHTHLELAVLAALARGQTSKNEQIPAAAEDLAAVLDVCRALDDERAVVYSDLLLASVSQAVREAVMTLPAGYQFQSEFALKHRGEGRVEGRAEGQARAVVTVLEARGIPLSDEQRRRIQTATDLETLDRMVRRAATARSADDVFED